MTSDRQQDLATLRRCIAEANAELDRGHEWARPQLDKLYRSEAELLRQMNPTLGTEDAREATIREYRRQQDTVVARLHREEQAS